MKSQGTKQLMQDLQAAIKDLKTAYNDRSKIIENIAKGKSKQEEEEATTDASQNAI